MHFNKFMLHEHLTDESTLKDVALELAVRKAGFPGSADRDLTPEEFDKALQSPLKNIELTTFPEGGSRLVLSTAAKNAVNWLRRRIKARSHEFSALRGSAFAKRDDIIPGIISLERYLSISTEERSNYRVTLVPTYPDHLLLKAMARFLAKDHEQDIFCEEACAYIPDRGGRDVVRLVMKHLGAGHRVVFRYDIASFNETVDHNLLFQMVDDRLSRIRHWEEADSKLFVNLLKSYCQRVGEALRMPGRGIGMGSPLTPWLTNVYLTVHDDYLKAQGFHFVRYGDDVAVFFDDEGSAEQGKNKIRAFLENKLQQSFREEKVLTIRLGPDLPRNGFDFCLFNYSINPEDKIVVRIRDQTIESVRKKIRYITQQMAENNSGVVAAYDLREETIDAAVRISKSIGFMFEDDGDAILDTPPPEFSKKGWGYWLTLDAQTDEIKSQLRRIDGFIHKRLAQLESGLGGQTSIESKFYHRLRMSGLRTFMDAWNMRRANKPDNRP